MSRLSSGFPSSRTGPESPPSLKPSRLSRRRPPRSFSALLEWHLKHCMESTGRIFVSKKRSCSGVIGILVSAAGFVAPSPARVPSEASGLAFGIAVLRGNDLRYSARERIPSPSASILWNSGSIASGVLLKRGDDFMNSRYSSSESLPSKSASPRLKMVSGSNAGTRCAAPRPVRRGVARRGVKHAIEELVFYCYAFSDSVRLSALGRSLFERKQIGDDIGELFGLETRRNSLGHSRRLLPTALLDFRCA